jgi:hypothetical protein
VAEDGFDDAEAVAVDMATQGRVNFLFHPLQGAARALVDMADFLNLRQSSNSVGFFKPLEKLFMSWWSMDWRVGEDKDLGPKEKTGTTFYTSLKFWAREKSDLWNFARFLKYWGWEL